MAALALPPHGSGGVDDDDHRYYLHEFFDDIKQRYNDNNSRCNNRSSIVWSMQRARDDHSNRYCFLHLKENSSNFIQPGTSLIGL